MSRMFANSLAISIPGRVIPKTQKMVFDAALLITLHYKVRIKGKVEQSRERSSTSPLHFSVVAIEKRAFRSPSTKVANFTLLLQLNHFQCRLLQQKKNSKKKKLSKILFFMIDIQGVSKNLISFRSTVGFRKIDNIS